MRALRRIAAAVAVPVAAGAVVALLPAMAQAAPAAGQIKLCSRGSYSSLLSFPEYGGSQTLVVEKGNCMTFSRPGDGVERVDVRKGNSAYIASFQWNHGNVTVNTIDTASGASFYLS